jgi:hypothetical protein
MKLTDILPIEKWIALEKDLHNRYGLDVNVFDSCARPSRPPTRGKVSSARWPT